MAVTDQSHDADRHVGRLEGIIEQMVKDQAEYRQDMRAISTRIDNVTNRIDRLLYWQLGLLSVIIGGIIGIYFK